MEDRFLLSTVSFSAGSETVNESAGNFSIPVTLSGTTKPIVGTVATGFDALSGGLAFGSNGNLYAANFVEGSVNEVTPAGVVLPSPFATGFKGPTALAFDSAGNLYVANEGDGTISEVSSGGRVSTILSGLDQPTALAFDAAGNLYVSDFDNDNVSKVTPAGKVTTFASGFDGPDSLAFDAGGNLYVGNLDGETVSKVTPTGKVTTFTSGLGAPAGMAFAAGNLYVCNNSGTSLKVVTPNGTPSTFAAGFNLPDGLAVDAAGNLYVSDSSGTIFKVSDTVTVPFTFGNSADSKIASGVTASPLTFRIGPTTQFITGTLLADPGPSQTLTFHLGTPSVNASLGSPSVNTLTITEPAGVQFSTGSETVNESAGTFSIPVTVSGTATEAVAVPFVLGGTAASGVAYSSVTASPLTFAIGQTTQNITGMLLSDPGPTQTLTFTLGTPIEGAALLSPSVNTLTIAEPARVQFGTGGETVSESAGTFSIPVTLSGTVTPTISTFASGFDNSVAVAFDSAGNLYVGNTGDNTVSKVTPAGVKSTFASTLDGPFALAFDAAGNLYVANSGNNIVSEVTPAGVVSTFATGLDFPYGLAFDSAGNLYVANLGNNTVTELSPAGVAVKTLATSGFNGPSGLAFDSLGNLYVANLNGESVSEVTPAGVVSTFASGIDGPTALAFDAAGNLYVSRFTRGTVSQVTPAGVVSPFASGFSAPWGLAFDAGNLYVANPDGTTNTTVNEVSDTVSVPFIVLGGTAVSGVAFSGVTAGPLTFRIGQTTQFITGTLLADPGPSRTLTFTLGTPMGDFALGSISVNTLIITEPTTVTTPTPTSTAPLFLGEQRVFSGKGKHKKLKGFEFLFNAALNAGSAQSTGNYHVTQKHGKKPKVLRVKSALYNPSSFSVTISVSGFKTSKPAQVSIEGVAGGNGVAIPQIIAGL